MTHDRSAMPCALRPKDDARRALHQSDATCFEPDSQGFYVPRCECGWSWGPVPDIETLCDVLMAHAFEEAVKGGR